MQVVNDVFCASGLHRFTLLIYTYTTISAHVRTTPQVVHACVSISYHQRKVVQVARGVVCRQQHYCTPMVDLTGTPSLTTIDSMQPVQGLTLAVMGLSMQLESITACLLGRSS